MVRRACHVAIVSLPVWLATPALAGMTQDLADCKSADRPSSAGACTRVMQSGRLPRHQFYIGHYNRAWSHRRMGDSAKAVADFDQAARLRPDYADTYFARGLAHHDLGNLDKAHDDFSRHIAMKPDNWAAYYSRALLLRRKNDLDRALADLDKAASLKPDAVDVTLLRALIVADKGDHASAMSDVNRVISTNASSAPAYYARALLAFRKNDLGPAGADVDKALAIESAFPAAQTLSGRILEARGNTEAAKARYTQALQTPPGKQFDTRAAQDKARERLAALSDAVPARSAAAPQAPPAKSSSGKQACSRFVPTAGMTIRVECGD
jgi:tetratricopeptide (TPR) repeat protein